MEKYKKTYLIVLIGLLLLTGFLLLDKLHDAETDITSFNIEDLSEKDISQMTEEFQRSFEDVREDSPNEISKDLNSFLSMSCDGGKEFKLNFIQVSNSPGPGEIPVPIEFTGAEVVLDNGEEFHLGLDGNINSREYTFSNIKYKDQSKVVILNIESNIAELFLDNGEKYQNCKNNEIEKMRQEVE